MQVYESSSNTTLYPSSVSAREHRLEGNANMNMNLSFSLGLWNVSVLIAF